MTRGLALPPDMPGILRTQVAETRAVQHPGVKAADAQPVWQAGAASRQVSRRGIIPGCCVSKGRIPLSISNTPHRQPYPEAERWLTVAQVAVQTSLSEITIRRMIRDGKLPAYHVGRAVRIKACDVGRIFDRFGVA